MHNRFLEQCEREPLQHSGTLMGHGCLLVVDGQGRISHVAANVAEFLGAEPAVWLDQPLPEVLADYVAASGGHRRVFEAALDNMAGEPLDIVTRPNPAGGILLELTPHQPDSARSSFAPLLPSVPVDEAILADHRETLVHRIAAATGFQRVMFYRFQDDGDGEVIAEHRQGEVYGSYLGLRFPASDIPQIARQLYLKNPWRLIPDAAAEPVSILARDPKLGAPDLTGSDLRGVSPVHRVYLANMGVRASLSLPIAVAGSLAALIACHHNQPRTLPLALLERMAALVRNHALEFTTWQSRRRMNLVDSLERHFDAVRDLIRRHGDLGAAWPEFAAWLMGEFRVDGALLRLDDTLLTAGTVLEPAALTAFEDWLHTRQEDIIWSGDSLSRQVPHFPLSEIAGVLALRLGVGEGRSLGLYLCRVQHIHEVAWGGNPYKPIEHHDGDLGIAPRHSFEKWVEKRMGYSRFWDNEARLLALKLRELLQREILHGHSAEQAP